MKSSILAFNLGHDGAVVLLNDASLVFSLEREKNSHPRYSSVSIDLILDGILRAGAVPSVVAIGGWSIGLERSEARVGGYHGIDDACAGFSEVDIFGHHIRLFQSTHERSHIFGAYGMSPVQQGRRCYVLVWEGEIGAFYEIDECLRIRRLGSAMEAPGYKYSFVYDLAHPAYERGKYRLDSAGKLMALGSFSSRSECTAIEQRAIDQVLSDVSPPTTDKRTFEWSPYFNCGVSQPEFAELAGKFSDRLFEVHLTFARQHMNKGYPLLIGGGCGLNCEWNTKWREAGIFEDVFVSPVTNDSGSAIGTAIEAKYQLTGNAKIDWSVYSGLEFEWDESPADFVCSTADLTDLAEMLAAGNVIAWVHGRYEIGPRALGHRSLLAAPFDKSMTNRLNWIKYRELYRPLAPVCLEEDVSEYFDLARASPYMLYLCKARSSMVQAVTHVDGSARVQTVSAEQDSVLHRLLCAFKRRTGVGVLCNTSLNYHGKGLINRSSDLFNYVRSRGIDAAVVNGMLYRPMTRNP